MLSASWTVKRMEEGTRIIWKRVCVEEMLTVNILKTQVFPTFSKSYFVTLGLFSVPSSGFLYSTSAFDNTHKFTI